ncbi:MAG: amidase, partial [Pseudomonadota bacterium]|nr:amidase [Pseudomonadota bacterium]
MTARRVFLKQAPLGMLAMHASIAGAQAQPSVAPGAAAPGPAPAPTIPGAAKAIGVDTFAAAESLMQVTLTPAQRALAAASWHDNIEPVLERRTGPRKLAIPAAVAPASTWRPLAGSKPAPARDHFVASTASPGPLPSQDALIAFAPVTALSYWIAHRSLSSERLTRIYLERIRRFDGQLRSVITLTEEHALTRARQADREIAAGHYRGPLHGIPYGVKDLLDTAGIATTWGAEPLRNHLPARNATVVDRLDAAGAVMIAKLSLGALALNDIWFGGQTMNPWLPEEGASGSSAGPGAATAAGLVGFSIGSETEGSIVSPSTRCGITGLRPTFGRVPRGGAMTLCWSLDKLGPMTRSVEDAMLVLHAISGADAADVGSVTSHLEFDAHAPVRGLKVGYIESWMDAPPANGVERKALTMLTQAGLQAVPLTLPDWPYSTLNTILFAEAAAAFEDFTLDGRTDQLRQQGADAWPNQFRQGRFISAVDLVQAER